MKGRHRDGDNPAYGLTSTARRWVTTGNLPEGQEMKFPKHEASLTLTHNEHKSYYRTVAESIEDGSFGMQDDEWVSPEQKAKAIETNDCWTLQWYPNTPVGFCVLSAADLDVLLAAANEA
jgi:hypothetical protein